MVDVLAEDFRRESSLCAGKVVDEVTKRRKPGSGGPDRITIGERKRALRIDRNKLLRSLDHYVKAGAKRMLADRVRNGILKLPVVEDTALRESRIGTDAGYVRSAAAKQDLRRAINLLRVAVVEEHVEPAITKARLVGCVRRERACPVDV